MLSSLKFSTKSHYKTDLIKCAVRQVLTLTVVACIALAVFTRPVVAEVYEYTGNAFTLFSCGPFIDEDGNTTGTSLCTNSSPTNTYTSYLATDFVSATLTLTDPLDPNLDLFNVATLPGFHLTMDDGQQALANSDAAGLIAQISTDASGQISAWRLIINTGGTLNGGIATQKWTFISDSGTLACCDPGVSGDLARNSGIAGMWSTGGDPDPAVMISNLIAVVSDPLLGLTSGQVSSFSDKLNNALNSIQAGSNKQAINQLNAFIKSVQSNLKTGKISTQTATSLIEMAGDIIALL